MHHYGARVAHAEALGEQARTAAQQAQQALQQRREGLLQQLAEAAGPTLAALARNTGAQQRLAGLVENATASLTPPEALRKELDARRPAQKTVAGRPVQ
jgi:hypothetical protein